jgi:hypothetical protein
MGGSISSIDQESYRRLDENFDNFITTYCNVDPKVHSSVNEVIAAFYSCCIHGKKMGDRWDSNSIYNLFIACAKFKDIQIFPAGFHGLKCPFEFRYFSGISIKHMPHHEKPCSGNSIAKVLYFPPSSVTPPATSHAARLASLPRATNRSRASTTLLLR